MSEATAVKKEKKSKYGGPKTGGGPYKAKGSKYGKKRNNPAPKVKRLKRGEPVFLYYVEGTDILAKKTPCEKDYEATPQRPAQSHLGTWKNPVTGRKCKVTRVRNKPRNEPREADETQSTNESESQT